MTFPDWVRDERSVCVCEEKEAGTEYRKQRCLFKISDAGLLFWEWWSTYTCSGDPGDRTPFLSRGRGQSALVTVTQKDGGKSRQNKSIKIRDNLPF